MGSEYRRSRDHVTNSDVFAFLPANVNQAWTSLFAQGGVALRNDLRLTLGARAERNDYTGTEFLPNARLAWKPAPDHLLWSAASRTVRAPSRLDRDPFIPGRPPFLLAGGPNVRSETANVYEPGYHLHTQEIAPSRTFIVFGSGLEARTHGIELWGTWMARSSLDLARNVEESRGSQVFDHGRAHRVGAAPRPRAGARRVEPGGRGARGVHLDRHAHRDPKKRLRERSLALRSALIAALLVAAWPWLALAQSAGDLEQRVKAAFLSKFAAYAEWPREALGAAGRPIMIGVAGGGALADELEQAVAERRVEGRPMRVFRLPRNADTCDVCHILFIARDVERPRASALLAAARGKPILTVTESEGAPPPGSVINFVASEDRIRFDISREAEERNGLRLASALLSVARQVRGKP